jgi:hypothetical protein
MKGHGTLERVRVLLCNIFLARAHYRLGIFSIYDRKTVDRAERSSVLASAAIMADLTVPFAPSR